MWRTTNPGSGGMAPKKVHSTRISSIHQTANFADYVMTSACSDWHFHIVFSGKGRGCTKARTTDWKVWHLVENRSCWPAQRRVSRQTCCSCISTVEARARSTPWLFLRHHKYECVQSREQQKQKRKINGVLKYTDDFRKQFYNFLLPNAKKRITQNKKTKSWTANIKLARGHNVSGCKTKRPKQI